MNNLHRTTLQTSRKFPKLKEKLFNRSAIKVISWATLNNLKINGKLKLKTRRLSIWFETHYLFSRKKTNKLTLSWLIVKPSSLTNTINFKVWTLTTRSRMWVTQKDGKTLLKPTQKLKRNWWVITNLITLKKIIDFFIEFLTTFLFPSLIYSRITIKSIQIKRAKVYWCKRISGLRVIK